MSPAISTPLCVLERLNSHDVEPALRFEAWRKRAHRWMEMQPLAPGAVLDADLVMLSSSNCSFGAMRTSAYEMRETPRRMAHEPGMVVLTFLQTGEVVRDALPGEHQRISPGMLGLYDPWRHGNYRWSAGSREAFLALPREDVQLALGYEPGNVLIPLERCALAPALSAQLVHLALLTRQSQHVDDVEYAGMLQATRALALLALRNLSRHGEASDLCESSEDLSKGRYVAAIRYLEVEAHRHDLDSAAIARAAGCSRSRLYDAFSKQGTTVMGTLRELRLQRAHRLIAQSLENHMGALAWRCGFADQSGFSKAFRERFGLSPTQWRHQVWFDPKP